MMVNSLPVFTIEYQNSSFGDHQKLPLTGIQSDTFEFIFLFCIDDGNRLTI